MDFAFILTLAFIFLTALFGTYVKRKSRDHCLKDFAGFNVTLEMKDGQFLWGRPIIFFNGLELVYPTPHHRPDGQLETSFLLYESDMTEVRAIYRYHDELSPKNQKRRRIEIERSAPPNFRRRMRRNFRNFINIFRDAFNQSFGLVLSKMKATSRSTVLKTQDTQLNQMGQIALGAVPNAYEPILERYIGYRVVLTEVKDNTKIEYEGILKEYTGQWVELIDCRLRKEHRFQLADVERLRVNRNLDFFLAFRAADEKTIVVQIRLENHGLQTIHIKSLEAENYSRMVGKAVGAGATTTLEIDDLPVSLVPAELLAQIPCELELRSRERTPGVKDDTNEQDEKRSLPPLCVIIEAEREVDLCFPRVSAAVRHGGQEI